MEIDLKNREIEERLKLDEIIKWSNNRNVKFDAIDSDMLSFYYMTIEEWQQTRRMEKDPVQIEDYSEMVNLFIGAMKHITYGTRT